MVYFKFINTETRSPGESNTCNNRRCPEFRVMVNSDNLGGADCRQRTYTSSQLAVPPVSTNVLCLKRTAEIDKKQK